MWCERMADPVIRVENLGKRYRLGQLEPYKTLRDTIARAVRAPFRSASSVQSGNLSPAPKPDGDGYVWALRNVSFEVNTGEVVGIIGRNGAGKTTLLKILSRITEPTEGRAEVRGRVGSLLEVGTGFHSELTGRENVYLNGAVLGMKRTEIKRKFNDIVAFAELERFIDTPVKRYSSGMYVRLAFSVAAHLEPDILLVDEVLAVGDVAFQKKCLGRMGKVAREGRTVLFVSHNMNAILELCDRGLFLRDGSAAFLGDTEDAVEEYMQTIAEREYGFADLSNHTGRPLGMPVIARRIEVHTAESDETRSKSFHTGDDLVFDIHYSCGDQTIDLVQLGVSSMTGQRVFTVGTHLCPDFEQALKGQGVIECHLPNVLLADGEYSVTVMMGKRLPPRNIDYVENALRFRIESDNYFGTGLTTLPGQGHLAQKSQWRLMKEVNQSEGEAKPRLGSR